ncbi:aminoacyl-tRNA hydrolase [Paenibacillus sp. N1-5-1-14]|uniref:aminoacyl-tRNA hydrolase n=1 Tax=Paenibacillus radicibacter TaxID=2972488 RepID=UPI002158B533|nr:aminoacyl-tRNA hydrolase [Paenibacillus radicibacter]MCR8645867.1 aminoacyl-tRNA hydrolase [Paenibacillus radicibacter]
MKCFIGLGNPGGQYEDTRHNIGFMAVDHFAKKWNIGPFQKKCKGLLAEGHVNGQKVYLLKPLTYMNLSGESLRALMDFYKIDIADVVVLYDDLDTEYGKIRLRYKGSAGGHNGIKSIIGHTGTQEFNRMRIGISRPQPGRQVVDYVLQSFSKEEFKQMEPILDKLSDAMEYSLANDFERTMAKFNA